MATLPSQSHEQDDDIMAEYEETFRVIDSNLDAIRSSFQTEDEPPNKSHTPVGATILVDKEQHPLDEDNDDNSTLDGSLSLHVGKLQAALAQQSAQEMERIVQTLQSQQRETETQATKEKDSVSTSSSSSSNIPRWMVLLVLVPTLLCALLWFKLLSSASSPVGIVSSSATAVEQPSRRVQQTFTRQICRTINGQQYCESEHESHRVDEATTGGRQAQRQVHYQRQQCQYVNGESYCESYQESRSATADDENEDRQRAVSY